MRAIRFAAPSAPLVEVDLERPTPGGGEVLVEVTAAGICHSDAHYRAGSPAPPRPPVTLGHEIAGTVIETGEGVDESRIGTDVAIHYVISCGGCSNCLRDREQFCESYEMLGNTIDGGFAGFVVVPDANAVAIPSGVSVEAAAIMMCSTVTALHALNRARLQSGERVAVFGTGGLGQSAVRLALALGAGSVFAVDLDPERLAAAEAAGAHIIDATSTDPVDALQQAGRIDVALDMVGSGPVMRQALDCLRHGGRAVAVGITDDAVSVQPYRELIAGELELIGANDHTRSEVVAALQLAASGAIDLDDVITERVPLQAAAVNAVLDRLDAFGSGLRTVVIPGHRAPHDSSVT